MSQLSDEITSQPSCWARGIELGRACAQLLPRDGERAAVIGCGTSSFVAQACASLREQAGLGETDAFTPSEMPTGRRYDRLLAISRSGTTTEVLQLLTRLDGRYPSIAVTADASAPITGLADDTVCVDFADGSAIVQARFPTTVLTLMRAAVGHDLGHLIDDAGVALEGDLDDGLVDAQEFTFLGAGWTVGIAHEAALKLREAAGAWTESYPAMEFRHGPIAIAAPGRVVWAFGGLPTDGLRDDVERTGARLEATTLDPLADLVRVQRLAVARAERDGLDPDNPRHLSRSVIFGDQG